MNTDPYQKLFKVVQLLLVLSHGQASVERDFSVNKELEVENLANQSLVAQRLVCDHNTVGGILNVSTGQPLLASCSAARKHYERYLEQQRQNKKSEERSQKRKSLLTEIEELKEKKGERVWTLMG